MIGGKKWSSYEGWLEGKDVRRKGWSDERIVGGMNDRRRPLLVGQEVWSEERNSGGEYGRRRVWSEEIMVEERMVGKKNELSENSMVGGKDEWSGERSVGVGMVGRRRKE